MFRRFMVSFSRFMMGRYGTDQLNRFLLIAYVVVWLLCSLVLRFFLWPYRIVSTLNSVIAFWLLFRTLSRNIPRRRAENEWFLRQRQRLVDIRRCRYRRCPGCGSYLRLPIKRGRRTVTCHRCRAQFKAFFL